MGKSRDKFLEVSRGPSPAQIFNTSQMASSPAYKYARAVCSEVLGVDGTVKGEIAGRIKMAKPKSIERIIEKAVTDYDGDTTRIKDGARLTIYTHTAKEMERALKVFAGKVENQSFNVDMRKRGYKFDEEKSPKDFITNPKRSGFMALYLNFKIGDACFEVQIYPESMKDTYKQTHALYEDLRVSGNLERWQKAYDKALVAQTTPPLINTFLTGREIKTYQKILDLHREAAEKAGLMKFVKNFPTLDCPPPVMDEPDIMPYPEDVDFPHAARPARSQNAPEYDA